MIKNFTEECKFLRMKRGLLANFVTPYYKWGVGTNRFCVFRGTFPRVYR